MFFFTDIAGWVQTASSEMWH